MGWLIITLAGFTALICAAEAVCWVLFRRKMEPLHFPSYNDPGGSHSYYLERLRAFAIAHTVTLCVFIWIFCIALWW